MVESDIIVSNSNGIHARPSSMIVKKASEFKSAITLFSTNSSADAKSIMSVLMLAAGPKEKIKIRAQGVDEKEALKALIELFEKNFNE